MESNNKKVKKKSEKEIIHLEEEIALLRKIIRAFEKEGELQSSKKEEKVLADLEKQLENISK